MVSRAAVLRAATASVVGAALLAGCGSPTHQGVVRSTPTTVGETTTTGAGTGSLFPSPTGADGRPVPTTRLAGGTSASTAPGATTTLPTGMQGVPRAPLETQIAKSCVRHGGAQTVTVKSTPGFQVAIATQWPDGGGHLEYNGWAVGKIPPGGTFVKTWTIPAGAAFGEARTDVEVTNDQGTQIAFDHPKWKIAANC